jgi:hypothetical protein
VRDEPAGDFDYERGDIDYAAIRRPEPRFAVAVRRALGDARTVVNVGAGAGSYEPDDLEVTAVEPSASMRAQRPDHLVEAIDAVAEALPFEDGSFDAALATITVHQWRDLDLGLSELRRVARGPVVIMTFDPEALWGFWLAEYAPEMVEHESGRMPAIDRIVSQLGGPAVVEDLPIPAGCADGFMEAYFGRPEAFLDERVRRAQSAWGFVDDDVAQRALRRLRAALEDGSWEERFGHLRTAVAYPGSLRLIVARPG